MSPLPHVEGVEVEDSRARASHAAGMEMPDWISELGGDFYELPEWVWSTSLVQREVEGGLPPHAFWRTLLRHSGLPFGPRSLGLWLSTYCGGRDKLHAVGRVRGSRVHCWPKLRDLAAASGAGERSVTHYIAQLEKSGWLVVERHTNKPSDYWLALPDLRHAPDGTPPEDWNEAELLDDYEARQANGAQQPGSQISDPPRRISDPPRRISDPRVAKSADALGLGTSVHSLRSSTTADPLREPAGDDPASERQHQVQEQVPDRAPKTEGQGQRQERQATKAEQLEALPVEDRLADLERRLREDGRYTDEQVEAQLASHRAAWGAAA